MITVKIPAAAEQPEPENDQEELVGPEALAQIVREAKALRPDAPPAWLDEIVPANPPMDGTNGMHRIIGAWPGDETDDEIAAALERLS